MNTTVISRRIVLFIVLALPLFISGGCGSAQTEVTSVMTEAAAGVPPAPGAGDAPYVFDYDFSGRETSLPIPSAQKLPCWKGFNLLNLFNAGSRKTFDEDEFKLISELGFNFVRLPMDYRCWAGAGGWDGVSEPVLAQIDNALEYCIKYDIHLCLNLHRAPGYTVANPPETADLWAQADAQEAFAAMWGMFAARYKYVPNEYLSFNLVNEPPDIDENIYAAVMGKAAEAIRAQCPERLIIADGLNYGMKPSRMLKEIGLAQSTRGYQPFGITHYKADWITGSDSFPAPAWPFISLPQYLYGFAKRDMRSAYIIEFNFQDEYQMDVNVGVVSNSARLVVKADGATVFERLFESKAGTGEWKKEVYAKEWNIYQNVYDKDYRAVIPAGTRAVTLEVTDGDWMSVNAIKFAPASGNGPEFSVIPNNSGWGEKIPRVIIDADGGVIPGEEGVIDRAALMETYLKPWIELKDGGCGVIAGEWGVYNKTPHGVALNWMGDMLQNFEDAGIGWALWNFADAFGVFDSGRADVEYENYAGRKLDREMLDLLRRYL